jgi:hypothetical protein
MPPPRTTIRVRGVVAPGSLCCTVPFRDELPIDSAFEFLPFVSRMFASFSLLS